MENSRSHSFLFDTPFIYFPIKIILAVNFFKVIPCLFIFLKKSTRSLIFLRWFPHYLFSYKIHHAHWFIFKEFFFWILWSNLFSRITWWILNPSPMNQIINKKQKSFYKMTLIVLPLLCLVGNVILSLK